MESINKLRLEIDEINLQLGRLLIERKKVAERIGQEKRKLGIEVYDRYREINIFQMLRRHFNQDEYNYLESIFQEVIKKSRQVQYI